MPDNILWIFIHPIRSGGNTLIEFIKGKVSKEEIFLASVARYEEKPEKIDPKKIRFLLGHATYYGMHKLAPHKIPKYFVILRDPAERVISYYNAKMQEVDKKIPFEEWYKNQMKNDLVHFLDLKYNGSGSSRVPVPKFLMPIIRRLNYKIFYSLQTAALKVLKLRGNKNKQKLENAKKLIDACWFVSILERSDEDMKFILTQMGFKNPKFENDGVSKKILVLDDALRQKIYKENPLDVQLYQYALKVREQKLKEIKATKKSKGKN